MRDILHLVTVHSTRVANNHRISYLLQEVEELLTPSIRISMATVPFPPYKTHDALLLVPAHNKQLRFPSLDPIKVDVNLCTGREVESFPSLFRIKASQGHK